MTTLLQYWKKRGRIMLYTVFFAALAIVSIPNITHAALTDSIHCYYKLDGNSNDSLSNCNGSDTSISYSFGAGIINEGANFSGSSLISNPYLIPYGDFTFNGWVKVPDTATTQTIFSMRGSGDGCPINSFFYSGNVLYHRIRSNACTGLTDRSATAPTVNNFHMVTASYNNSTGAMTIYIDGIIAGSPATYSGGTWSNVDTNYLGNDVLNGEWLVGDVDEVGIWNRVLTSDEVVDLYNAGDGIQYPFSGPTPPPPDSNFGDLIASSTVGFASTTGFQLQPLLEWTKNNLFLLYIGSIVGAIYGLRYWIAAVMIIGAIIFLSIRAFKFFKH